jgi:hypothetical protein
MSSPETWQIKFNDFTVLDSQEDGLLSDGDEPYFIFFGFRSRPKTAGSTHVFWGGELKQWSEGLGDGAKRNLPMKVGTLNFPNVVIPSVSETLGGVMPEILGFILTPVFSV